MIYNSVYLYKVGKIVELYLNDDKRQSANSNRPISKNWIIAISTIISIVKDNTQNSQRLYSNL